MTKKAFIGLISLIVFALFISGFIYLIIQGSNKLNDDKRLLEMKCKQAYSLTISNNQKAEELNLPYDEELTVLRKICGNRFVDKQS